MNKIFMYSKYKDIIRIAFSKIIYYENLRNLNLEENNEVKKSIYEKYYNSGIFNYTISDYLIIYDIKTFDFILFKKDKLITKIENIKVSDMYDLLNEFNNELKNKNDNNIFHKIKSSIKSLTSYGGIAVIVSLMIIVLLCCAISFDIIDNLWFMVLNLCTIFFTFVYYSFND